ncbi:MAG: DUF4153 domain-containing protein [Pedobacter sp.]|nr:DUF4153 domain-containing protein [Pedobacter sp.]
MQALLQYVLIPLMTIYLIILLVYEIKIILIWSLHAKIEAKCKKGSIYAIK